MFHILYPTLKVGKNGFITKRSSWGSLSSHTHNLVHQFVLKNVFFYLTALKEAYIFLRLMGVHFLCIPSVCLQESTSRKMQKQATSSKSQREESAIYTKRM